ncbi:M16 family metallopeptidase [Schaalia vaccimaxillae]|uniref:M16 family metallopeptidase n=1 Tax=Schaalia vaccimaxillae TaxID=183916 RepID=UPI0003B641AA|nr:pitrilysin family protein [Schaalia vaccimaxillae]
MTPPIGLPLDQGPSSSSFEDAGTRVKRTVTLGGTRIVTQRVPAMQSVSLGLWVPVGSRDETNEGAGSTHFLEHLLFKGTSRRSALDIAVAFDCVGGESNAETAREHTAYWARVLGEDLPMAIDVITDMVADSLITPVDFDMEKGVILDELAMSQDSPIEVIHDAFQLAVHGDVPAGRPIGGTSDAIRAVTRDAVWDHYKQTYGPDNLVVTAAGNVDHQQLAELVDQALARSSWNDIHLQAHQPRPRRMTNAPEPVEHDDEITRIRDVEQAHLILGTRGMKADDPNGHIMSVLLSILGGSLSSRLFQEIREKRGLAYTTYAFESALSDSGTFGMYAGTSRRHIDEVARIMVGQLEDLAANGPTEEELSRVRGQVRGSVALGLEDNWSRMMRLGRAEISGTYRTVDETLTKIDGVTAQQVSDMAAELAGRHRYKALVLPRE